MNFLIPTIIGVLFGLALIHIKKVWLKLSLLFFIPPISLTIFDAMVWSADFQANDAPMALIGIIVLSGYWILVSGVTITIISVLGKIRKNKTHANSRDL
ncbi:hypothetical protein [Glaciecola sp. KUL10]|uniref:hypothetical protein n=1 Tax=Glaciecola sp. (strain KUL10) TaxID=2161813 RepID=UPI000D7895F1|nr:hypothetical protein [Glaciecola sp. KUL10]GBL05200.1 binding-protein-dependent transport systems inner membrane component [Glaciecola sp. KUL10]